MADCSEIDRDKVRAPAGGTVWPSGMMRVNVARRTSTAWPETSIWPCTASSSAMTRSHCRWPPSSSTPRPPGPRRCATTRRSGYFVLIHLNQGLARRTTRRTPETAQPVAQPWTPTTATPAPGWSPDQVTDRCRFGVAVRYPLGPVVSPSCRHGGGALDPDLARCSRKL